MKMIFSIMLGVTMAAAPLLAGQEPTPEKEKQKQDEPKKQPPPNQQQEPQTEKPKPKPEKQQPEPATPSTQKKPDEKQKQPQEKEKQKQAKEEEKKSKDNKQEPEQNGQQSSRTQQSRQDSHGKGQRIPPEKFQASFGSQHHFHVQQLQDGRRFEHGGYWFEIVEVWPADWSYVDDCYIEEDAGEYYMIDLYHPGTRVSVIVVEG
jgi:outer membrane biosynthesis protein TonB